MAYAVWSSSLSFDGSIHNQMESPLVTTESSHDIE